ncbi:M23 family metallopeptidase [Virgibacillus halophilus]|uniref:M23 family metallopeptidase n=1 Tax=Tigheibacillus halophilus TaxID=361280 RepID=A0ABU5C301_9BACI|nr:M23 family metallopeptidase [Virgibacillus halophilus]
MPRLLKKAESNATSESSSSSSASTSGPTHRTAAADPAPQGGGMLSYPVNAPITSGYEARWGTFHYGIDFGVPVGTPIHAAASGVVFMTSTENDGMMNGYGNVVLVTHVINGKTYTTLYAHLNSIDVSEGQTVSRGQVIAHSGNTGESTGPHMHFEVHNGNWSYHGAVNPMPYLQ